MDWIGLDGITVIPLFKFVIIAATVDAASYQL